jgi:hypothetical protein
VLEEALTLALGERSAFLTRACADASLHQEVETLLVSGPQARSSFYNLLFRAPRL